MMTVWRIASNWPALGPGQVQVWRADLSRARPAYLSADEQARAERLLHPEAQRRFHAARGILRQLLARHLQTTPDHIAFQNGPQGKPELASPALRFNLSHSADLALVAVARDQEVGIDVEEVRPLPEVARLAERYCTPREADYLRRLPAADQVNGFLSCWVRKEAYLKRLGYGLAQPPDEVETWPGAPPTGSLVDLDIGPGYQAALAVERGEVDLACWQWDEQAAESG